MWALLRSVIQIHLRAYKGLVRAAGLMHVCLVLEAMSGLASDSFEAASRAAYNRLTATRRFEVTPRELFSQVSAFNRSLEALMQAFDEDMRETTTATSLYFFPSLLCLAVTFSVQI